MNILETFEKLNKLSESLVLNKAMEKSFITELKNLKNKKVVHPDDYLKYYKLEYACFKSAFNAIRYWTSTGKDCELYPAYYETESGISPDICHFYAVCGNKKCETNRNKEASVIPATPIKFYANESLKSIINKIAKEFSLEILVEDFDNLLIDYYKINEDKSMNILNAFKLLEDIQKVSKDAQEEYREYIETHKENVSKSAEWLKENLPELFEEVDIEKFNELIVLHDNSKYSEEEFLPYANRWFGNKKKTKEYELAWEHHWKNNPHHPEFWNGENMEYIYILEMICDWMSFGYKENNLKDIVSFYWEKARDDREKNLSKNTRKILDTIINNIDVKTN